MKIRPNRRDKRQSEAEEIEKLNELAGSSSTPIQTLNFKSFSELPLSRNTIQGLDSANFVEMTEIQKQSLGYSLCGRDVLGAAKTGSGKTLAFILPVIELLYKQKWNLADGLGALIISPTRELALQIFQVLRKVGKFHSLSAGLVIGGKDVGFERDRINRMNILVCTPGRLLQHMDSTPNFDTSNLQILVLDEADRILDLGFSKTLNAIIDHLPAERQTLLFSATQTKSIRDLARLSLHDPEYVAVHEKSAKSTPDNLIQNYLVCELFQKLDILFSFLKTHLKSKVLVFLSSCKQVRFAYETFCKLQPGIVLMCLHGKQRQEKRNIMFEKFCKLKAAVMFCTDIAARGLDFPAVDWVLQVDCPEDGDTYIHRVGRTARFNANGRALLMLTPSEEEGMLQVFEKKKIPIEKIAVNPSKTSSTIIPQLQSFCAQDPELKYLGEKSFICYVRSIWLQKNKNVFNVESLPLEEYASSLGLPGAPKIKFIRRLKEQKNQSRSLQNKKQAQLLQTNNSDESQSETDDQDQDGKNKSVQHATKVDKMFAKKNQSVLWSHYEKIKDRQESWDEKDSDTNVNDDDEDDDQDEGFLKLARKDHDLEDIPSMAPGFLDRPLSVRDKRNMKLKSRTIKTAEQLSSTKIHFDDDGVPHLSWKLETENEFLNDENDLVSKHQKYIGAISDVMKEADQEDKALHKQRLREKRRLKKMKERGLDKTLSVPESTVTLGSGDESTIAEESEQEFEHGSEYASDSESSQHEHYHPINKKPRISKQASLQEQEELALRLLES